MTLGKNTMAEDSLKFPNLFRLDGEIAIITGAGAGIGRQSALTLAKAGATVAVTDMNAERAKRVASEISRSGGTAKAWELNVADESAIVDIISEIAHQLGQLDILVNNAGIAKRMPTTELELEDWRKVFAVNVEGTFVCSREAGRYMLERRSGRIVNVVSIMGMVGGGLYPNLVYHASKGAVVNMTRALAAEWASQGIRVNAVAPTYVETEMTAPLREDEDMSNRIRELTPIGRFAEPGEIASGVLYLASHAASMVTGHILAIDGGWLAV